MKLLLYQALVILDNFLNSYNHEVSSPQQLPIDNTAPVEM